MNNDCLYEEYAKKLENEYRKAYDKIYIYTSSSLAIGNDLSIVMDEVVDILLSAQQDNRSLESVIGTNLRNFCDQLLEGYRCNRIKGFLNFFLSYWVLSTISAIFITLTIILDYMDTVPHIWNAPVHMGGFIISTCIGLIVGMLLTKMTARVAFTCSWYTRKVDTMITSLIFIIIIVLILFSLDTVETWFAIPRWIFLPTIIAYSVFGYLYKKKEKKQKKSDVGYISFEDTMVIETLLQLQKKYQKYCKKCQRKKTEVKDVSIWYEETYNKEIKRYGYLKIGFIVLVLLASILTILESGFIDGLLFTIILLCVEIPIYRFSKKGKNVQIKIHSLICQKNTDIFDETLKDALYNG